MKRITILRHAKSDWAQAELKDIDRPLNERGYHDAYQGSEQILQEGLMPDMIYSSTATRALSTALIFARKMQLEANQIQLAPWYYETDNDITMAFLRKLKSDLQHVMLVGHNPASTNICNAFVKSGGIDELPTCGLVTIDFDCEAWRDLAFGKGEIKYYQYPKMNKKI